jgi:hypothetical protein
MSDVLEAAWRAGHLGASHVALPGRAHAQGGPAHLDGRLACGFHNRRRDTTTHGDEPGGDGGADPPGPVEGTAR